MNYGLSTEFIANNCEGLSSEILKTFKHVFKYNGRSHSNFYGCHDVEFYDSIMRAVDNVETGEAVDVTEIIQKFSNSSDIANANITKRSNDAPVYCLIVNKGNGNIDKYRFAKVSKGLRNGKYQINIVDESYNLETPLAKKSVTGKIELLNVFQQFYKTTIDRELWYMDVGEMKNLIIVEYKGNKYAFSFPEKEEICNTFFPMADDYISEMNIDTDKIINIE